MSRGKSRDKQHGMKRRLHCAYASNVRLEIFLSIFGIQPVSNGLQNVKYPAVSLLSRGQINSTEKDLFHKFN